MLKIAKVLAPTILFVAAIVLAGCGGTPPAEEPAAVTEEPMSQPTEDQPPAPVTRTAWFPQGAEFVGVGPRVVVINDTSSGESVYRLYGPGTESGGKVYISQQWDESRIEERWNVVQRDPQHGSVMGLVTIEKNPSDGLAAGGRQLVLRTYDINGGPVDETAVPLSDDFSSGDIQEVGLLGDTLLVQNAGLTEAAPAGTRLVDAIDVPTGGRLWSVECGNGYASTTPMYAGDNAAAVGCDMDGVRGLDLTTGQTLWEHSGGQTQDFRYDASAPGVLDASEYAGSADVTIDLRSGQLLGQETEKPVIGDPISGLQALGKLRVYDPQTHSVVLDIDEATIDQLGDFSPISAFDGRLTFMAADGLNVVSLTTGEADPSTPTKSSESRSYTNVVADAGTGWVMLGSVDASWDPDSWINDQPIVATGVTWAVEPGGTISWADIGGPIKAPQS